MAAPSHRKTAARRIARMAAAGALSLGMVGVFALPAYATVEVEGQPDGAPAQRLVTAEVGEALLPLEGPSAEIDSAEIERQQLEAEATAAQERQTAAAQTQTAPARAELPAGAGAQGLLDAAYAQLGWAQDCTALVENALRAIGFGVGDLGTSVGEYARYGTVVSDGSYAPGDILIWPGQHVAIYAGNGLAVHGGFGGSTVVATAFGTISGMPSAVVRIG
ncbi:MAG: NlpC/P60 family protein [Leucobacter sp.]